MKEICILVSSLSRVASCWDCVLYLLIVMRILLWQRYFNDTALLNEIDWTLLQAKGTMKPGWPGTDQALSSKRWFMGICLRRYWVSFVNRAVKLSESQVQARGLTLDIKAHTGVVFLITFTQGNLLEGRAEGAGEHGQHRWVMGKSIAFDVQGALPITSPLCYRMQSQASADRQDVCHRGYMNSTVAGSWISPPSGIGKRLHRWHGWRLAGFAPFSYRKSRLNLLPSHLWAQGTAAWNGLRYANKLNRSGDLPNIEIVVLAPQQYQNIAKCAGVGG